MDPMGLGNSMWIYHLYKITGKHIAFKQVRLDPQIRPSGLSGRMEIGFKQALDDTSSSNGGTTEVQVEKVGPPQPEIEGMAERRLKSRRRLMLWDWRRRAHSVFFVLSTRGLLLKMKVSLFPNPWCDEVSVWPQGWSNWSWCKKMQ